MANCTFSLHFDVTPDALFANARDSIVQQGGTFAGTSQQGKASLPTDAGTVYWNYLVQGHSLQVEVTDKPWLVSCAVIQQQMAELVAAIPKSALDTVGVPVVSPRPTIVSQKPPSVSPQAAFVPAIPPPPFKVTTPPYGVWFIAGTLALLSLFWSARRLRWL